MDRNTRAQWPGRIAALVVMMMGIPTVLGLAAFFTEAPIVSGEPSPRTVIAAEQVRVVDSEETELQRRQAAEEVDPVVTPDLEAQTALIDRVIDAFDVAATTASPGPDGTIPSRSDQIAALEERLTMLSTEGIDLLVGLTSSQLSVARAEAIDIARSAAATELEDTDDVQRWADNDLQRALALSTVSQPVAAQVLDPIIRDALRPTFTIDVDATSEARAAASAQVEEVALVIQRGTPIVRVGDTVTDLQVQALRDTGQDGTDPTQEFAQALLLSVILTTVVAVYVRTYRPTIWNTPKQLMLMAVLLVMFTAILVAINTVDVGGNERHFLIPVGAMAMLATILFDARIGVLLVIPMVALISYQVPGQLGIVPFAAVSGLLSIPIIGRLTARGQLRQAAWQSTLAYIVLAGAFTVVYSGTEGITGALVAGALNGVLTAMMVNGLLPFLESLFGIITANSLLDFADRNHPLLRELEDKAIGTYNHSVMVANLASRACRKIGADPLLAEVMALYHDIGKVAKPYFFVENQVAISNPHDQLDDPRQSALIIQRHVTDGIEMAAVHKLPPEIVDGIRTHHGTTVVAYFYRQALQRAEDDAGPEPDEAFFRYKGRKPHSREQAVLMLSDCCEGAVRAASQNSATMSRDQISQIVTGLISDRVADGQLDDSPLTFADLRAVEQSLIEALEGVYHPRIQYPKDPKKTVEAVKQARLETEEEARAAEAADAARAQLPPGEQADADEANTGVVRRRGQATQPVNEAMVRSLDAARAAAPRNPAPVHDQDSHG
ncbi:Membrane protein [Euzebya pacifica]|uniref:Membrane protein n=1 Tax=Euzebya pacifica TaxID=1608957 RepID=A0A346XZ70_9ACTN|nr:HDIG domain-containing metalloprotein [Euzebya pacifica]AXV07517.1 Membrane protein [Euzebya pacifica]